MWVYYVYVYTCTCTYTYTYIYTCAFICVHCLIWGIGVHATTHTHINYACICTHTHTHTHTHMYTDKVLGVPSLINILYIIYTSDQLLLVSLHMQRCIASNESSGIDIMVSIIQTDFPALEEQPDLALELKVL